MATTHKQMFTQLPFDPESLGFDYKSTTFITIPEGTSLYHSLLTYVADNLTANGSSDPSFSISETASRAVVAYEREKEQQLERAKQDPDYIELKEDGPVIAEEHKCIRIGLGNFSFIDTEGIELLAHHTAIGQPMGTSYDVSMMKSLVIFSRVTSDQTRLSNFVTELFRRQHPKVTGSIFVIYNWCVKEKAWKFDTASVARSIESVVLPIAVRARLLNDMHRFLAPKTRTFFEKHGIPYKRSYLFYGVPGAGKTSLIQALAGKFRRNICFIQPTEFEMSDDSLRNAIIHAPANSIIVLEDIDSLFSWKRKAQTRSGLTFSGLLNALDGVGSSTGQIFIMTTNLRDELDPALIRNGRVDLHIEFTWATEEQMKDMWYMFYPDSVADGSGEVFAKELMQQLQGRHVAAAGLQHFFILHLQHSAEEALSHIHDIVDDLKEKEEGGSAGAATASADTSSTETTIASSTNTSAVKVAGTGNGDTVTVVPPAPESPSKSTGSGATGSPSIKWGNDSVLEIPSNKDNARMESEMGPRDMLRANTAANRSSRAISLKAAKDANNGNLPDKPLLETVHTSVLALMDTASTSTFIPTYLHVPLAIGSTAVTIITIIACFPSVVTMFSKMKVSRPA